MEQKIKDLIHDLQVKLEEINITMTTCSYFKMPYYNIKKGNIDTAISALERLL